MMQLLTSFAAFSLAGTVLLSLLPDGGVKRTAGMVVGLLTLCCWAEGVAALLGISLPPAAAATPLTPTAVTIAGAAQEAADMLSARWEALP